MVVDDDLICIIAWCAILEILEAVCIHHGWFVLGIFTYINCFAGFCPSIVVETRPWSAPSFPISPCRLNLHQNFETQGATGNQEAKRGLLTDEEDDLVNLHIIFSRSAASGSFILAAAVCDYQTYLRMASAALGFFEKKTWRLVKVKSGGGDLCWPKLEASDFCWQVVWNGSWIHDVLSYAGSGILQEFK